MRWLFAGQGIMGAAALEALAGARAPEAVLTRPSSPQDAGAVAAVADRRGLLVRHIGPLDRDPAIGHWQQHGALDAAVCCCWPERIPADLLALPAHGWLNLHPSALPAWRGAEPVGWQLLTAPRWIGCSVHRMTDQIDEGPILAEGAIPVEEGDNRGAVLYRAGRRLGELAAQALSGLADGAALTERAQDAAAATWCPPQGTVPLLDPRGMSAAAGARVARAFSPEPGIALEILASTERFALSPQPGASAGDLGPALGAGDHPGQTAALADGGLAVAFRDRWLRGRVWPRS